MKATAEMAFEEVLATTLLERGYEQVGGDSFDREMAIFPGVALAFIRTTQPKEWQKLEALHGEKTGERALRDLCKWLDGYGLARHIAPRLQVLRPHAAGRLLQAGPRTES